MNVHGIGNANGRPFATSEPQPPGHAPNKTGKTKPPDQASPPPPPIDDPNDTGTGNVVADPGEVAEAEKGPASGVLRHLEEGHFKGVSDVRLRINFFDELSARAAAAALPAVQEQSGDIVDTVNAELDALIDSLALDEEATTAVNGLREDFESEVQTALEQFASDGVLDRDALADAIESAFDQLVEELRQLLTPPVADDPSETDPEPDETPTDSEAGPTDPNAVAAATGEADATDAVDEPGDEPVDEPTDEPVDEPTDEPGADVDEALASLLSSFDEALSGLLGLIDAATQLPDPSPPTGNGVAYDKFLAIYNELRGSTGTSEPPPEEPIDTTA